MSKMDFNREFDAQHGKLVAITDELARVTCNNPGALTFAGTNTFIVGKTRLSSLIRDRWIWSTWTL